MKALAAAGIAGLCLLLTVQGADALVLVGFGDSITQGVPYINYVPNGDRVGGYEPPLEALYGAGGTTVLVHNYGWAGERTSGGLARIDGVLSAVEDLQFLLLLEGTNDLIDGTSPATVAFNLGVMVERVRAAGVQPVVGTITPDDRPDRFKPIAETNALIREMAADKIVPYCELNGAMTAGWVSWSDDLLHPNLAGYDKMAEVWHACVSPLSPPPPRPPAPGEADIEPILYLLLR